MVKIVLRDKLEQELEALRQEISISQFSRKVTNVEVFAFLLERYRNTQRMPESPPPVRLAEPSMPSLPTYNSPVFQGHSQVISEGIEFSDIELNLDD